MKNPFKRKPKEETIVKREYALSKEFVRGIIKKFNEGGNINIAEYDNDGNLVNSYQATAEDLRIILNGMWKETCNGWSDSE